MFVVVAVVVVMIVTVLIITLPYFASLCVDGGRSGCGRRGSARGGSCTCLRSRSIRHVIRVHHMLLSTSRRLQSTPWFAKASAA